MNQIEIWKKVAGFDKYSVSDQGNVTKDKNMTLKKLSPNNNGYVTTSLTKNKKTKMITVHRLVASTFLPNPEIKKSVDHINNDIKNYKLTNLRWATLSQNQQNQKKSIKNTSGFKGVSFVKKTNKWRADITINGKRINLGSYMNKEDAVNIRIQRAKDEYGEYMNACEIILNVS